MTRRASTGKLAPGRRGVSGALALACALASAALLPGRAGAEAPPARQLLFGDTHLHSSWSPDASLFGNRSVDPDAAYRFAKGQPVAHPFHGARVQLETPLDFLAVSDHAEYMGILPLLLQGDERVLDTPTGKAFAERVKAGRGADAFQILFEQVMANRPDPGLRVPEVRRSVWKEILDATERHYDPGRFTTLVAWEWSAMPGMANLHRIVLMREGRELAQRYLPWSAFDSDRPEDLWTWLDETAARTGAHFLAIPHNSNLSLGKMFERVQSDGSPIDARYARTRMRWEPVVEVTQVKGDSETAPNLSPTDEFADYEAFDSFQQFAPRPASYARSALRTGLELEAQIGVNPYRFGLIGATDSHTGLATAEENNFHGKFAIQSTPETVLAPAVAGQIRGIDLGAAGLAAVWAEANTREAIFDAFARREVYATTGPRLQLRFFGGWRLAKHHLRWGDPVAHGYSKGVPMGGELWTDERGRSAAPRFLVMAARDPVGANLDRIQIVKGWLEPDGTSAERIYDVALSDGRHVGADGKAPPVGNTVDLATARYANTIGAAELSAWWEDPDFDPTRPAFYYARLLEIPTPRHTLFDAVALAVPHPPEAPATLQERAYSSPIWVGAKPTGESKESP